MSSFYKTKEKLLGHRFDMYLSITSAQKEYSSSESQYQTKVMRKRFSDLRTASADYLAIALFIPLAVLLLGVFLR